VIEGDSITAWLINSFSIMYSRYVSSSTDKTDVQFKNTRSKQPSAFEKLSKVD